MKSYKIHTKPSTEPISLSEFKSFLKIDNTDEDTLLTSLISVARTIVENYCGISLITQKWKLTSDLLTETYLCRFPVSAIDSITTYGSDNIGTVWSSTNYRLDTSNYRVLFNDNYVLPDDINWVEIIYTTGYGASSDVPSQIKQAILIIASTLYDCRGVCQDMPLICKSLLNSYVDYAKLGIRE